MQRQLSIVLIGLALAGAPVTLAAPPAPPSAQAASEAPAEAVTAVEVQAHQAFVRIQGREVRGSATWTVAILDPASAVGTPAPPMVEGASARGARIRDGILELPEGLPPGTVLTFQKDLEFPRGPFAPSGTFRTVPGLPVARAELVVRASAAPLSVWYDSAAVPDFRPGRTDEVRIVWRDVAPDEVAEAVWSGGEGWFASGNELTKAVEPLVTDQIGRVLGQGVKNLTPTQAARRVFEEITLIRGPDVGWIARPARYVIDGGSGTRAERGLVLLSVLRAAGYDARPALYRPSTLPGTVPTALAAPSLLQRPLVAVFMADRLLWIDPGSDDVQLPALPAELTGAMAWVPGDLPRRLDATGAAEGTVPISGEVRLDGKGGESFNLTISATGAADDFLREALRGKSPEEQAQVFRPLLVRGREGFDRVTVRASGFEDRSRPLRITLSGHSDGRLTRLGAGLFSSEVPAVLAPTLAEWLPPRIAVREEVAVVAPPGLRLFTVVGSERTTHPAAVVARASRREAERVVVVTEVERPTRHPAPGAAARAAETLDKAARVGPQMLYLRDATPGAARAMRSVDLPAADRVTLEAMLWWKQKRYGKAGKLLKRFEAPVGLQALDDALVRYDAPYELRRELVDLAEDPEGLLATVPILVEMGRPQEAWARAAAVSTSRVARLRVDSRLWMVELQGDTPPDATDDPEGAARWRDPMELLAEADADARKASKDEQPDPRVLAARAKLLLEADRVEEALLILDQALAISDDPEVAVLAASASARAGDPFDDVRARLDAAVDRASADPEVLAAVSEALATAGDRQGALQRAVAAARLANTDTKLWLAVSQRAMSAGDLPVALHAARRASDLALTDKDAADQYTLVATLSGDQDAANQGWSRGGTPIEVAWPPSVNALLPHVQQEHLLAVLRHHDREVTTSPNLLSLRAQLELVQGDRDRAIRDGELLAERHRIARGGVVAFGASLGSAWSNDGTAPLDRLVRRDPAARSARLELSAVTGRPVRADLRAMADDPRAAVWGLALSDADALAARAPDWKPGAPPRGGAPRGFSANPVLGGARGVEAWSDPIARLAVVRHAGNTPLPPPLSVLYTPRTPPLRSLPGGGTVTALEGGSLPLYAAFRKDGDEHVIGLGYSPEDAARALEAAPPL